MHAYRVHASNLFAIGVVAGLAGPRALVRITYPSASLIGLAIWPRMGTADSRLTTPLVTVIAVPTASLVASIWPGSVRG